MDKKIIVISLEVLNVMGFWRIFSYQNSVRQGCPISTLLCLTAEPLHHVMSCNTNIGGIQIPLSNKIA